MGGWRMEWLDASHVCARSGEAQCGHRREKQTEPLVNVRVQQPDGVGNATEIPSA